VSRSKTCWTRSSKTHTFNTYTSSTPGHVTIVKAFATTTAVAGCGGLLYWVSSSSGHRHPVHCETQDEVQSVQSAIKSLSTIHGCDKDIDAAANGTSHDSVRHGALWNDVWDVIAPDIGLLVLVSRVSDRFIS
jgi:hypothetical protein